MSRFDRYSLSSMTFIAHRVLSRGSKTAGILTLNGNKGFGLNDKLRGNWIRADL